jgi:hypothetical protein
LVSKIIFRNIKMNNVSNPIIIDQYYCDSRKPCANQTSAISIENISFVHVRGTSASKEAIKISCSDSSPCRNILLQDIDLEPSNGDGFTESFCWEAYGSSSGQVYPPPCLSDDTSFLEQSVQSGITSAYLWIHVFRLKILPRFCAHAKCFYDIVMFWQIQFTSPSLIIEFLSYCTQSFPAHKITFWAIRWM